MRFRRDPMRIQFGCLVLLTALLFSACNSSAPLVPTVAPTQTAAASASFTPLPPDWFGLKMTDVQTGQSFTVNDFAGKVVLIETMAEWCPNCRVQENEVKKLHALVGNTLDLVSISLDTDLHEDAPSLRAYAKSFGYDWHFCIASLEVMRALGNLYSAEYLNPPLAPMLVIDRKGKAYGLPYGYKSAAALQSTIEPYLAQVR
jgi:thiol-disulfide isomerase/thioredoxin